MSNTKSQCITRKVGLGVTISTSETRPRTIAFAPIPYLPRLGCTGDGLPCDGSARGARRLPAAPRGGGPTASTGGGPAAPRGGGPAAPRGGGPTASTGGGPAAPRGGGPAAPTGGANGPPGWASRGRVSRVSTVDGTCTAACPLCCTCTSWMHGFPATLLEDALATPGVPVQARSRGARAMTGTHRPMGLWVCCISRASLGWLALCALMCSACSALVPTGARRVRAMRQPVMAATTSAAGRATKMRCHIGPMCPSRLSNGSSTATVYFPPPPARAPRRTDGAPGARWPRRARGRGPSRAACGTVSVSLATCPLLYTLQWLHETYQLN